MTNEHAAQVLALIRDRNLPTEKLASPHSSDLRRTKLRNIGGRPVIVPEPQSPGNRTYTLKLALAFAATYLIWGSTYLGIHYAVETIPPLVAAGIRHSIAGGILFVWAWVRGYRPKREHWIAGLAVGAFYFLGGHGMLHWAEQHVASGLAAVLYSSEAMFIVALGWMLGQQRITRLSVLGLGLGVIGVVILVGGELTMKGSSPLGLLAALASSLSWSVGVVISAKVKLPDDALARTAMPSVCGAVMLLLAAGATGEFHAVHLASISLKSVLGLAYLIVFGSIIAFTAYTWLLQRCSPALVATHTYANPVVAVLLGWLLASEPLTLRLVLASAVILGAIVLIRRGEQSAVRRAPVSASAAAASSITECA
jgi:drug/metabolite transporter (DMT)-like permease